MNEEYLPVVDEQGRVMGKALRSECHGNPALIHPVVHLHVFDGRHRLFLQRRSLNKDQFPGFWDTAVGGHVAFNEGTEAALLREAREELGLDAGRARFLYSYLMRNALESEFISTYSLRWDKRIYLNKYEISEGKFFLKKEIEEKMGGSFFTPNFEEEFKRLAASGVF